jgi:glycosyltransferase involved in cell wall biosynthesis
VNLQAVTPVILTLNEEANIARTLASLEGFPRVVIVDSGSTDRTEAIARVFRNVTWFVRQFEDHARQWRWAIQETGIESPFVLALDADMSAPAELCEEIEGITLGSDIDGGEIGFEYRIRGVPLVGSLYPAQLRLLRLAMLEVADAGHTQAFCVTGKTVRLSRRLVHDDRKPIESFVQAQLRYSKVELSRLLVDGTASRRLKSRIRRSLPVTPVLVALLAWLRAGGPFRGAAARRYALERLIYEAILRWRLENETLKERESSEAAPPSQPCR